MYAPVLPRQIHRPDPLPPDPRAELRAWQNGRCAGCGRRLAHRAYFHRDSNGLRVAALVCMHCASTRAPVPDPPIHRVSPLLRLRLTHGTTASIPRRDPALLQDALQAEDWDRFASPLHALWVAQDGRCALHHPGKPARERCSAGGWNQVLYVDHDHAGPRHVRSLLCPPCNSREGWNSGSALHRRLVDRLRHDPPARRCPATAGLTYRWVTGWARPAGWSPVAPPREPSRTRPRPGPRGTSGPGRKNGARP
jgi:hypothetical protein